MCNEIEFECIDKVVYIKDISFYSGVSYEIVQKWNSNSDDYCYTLKLYYFKKYSTNDGFVCCDRDYDYFSFSDKESLISIYETIRCLLRSCNSYE